MLNKKLKLFMILIGISTISLGIAYASISGIDLNIIGKSTSMATSVIKITKIELEDSYNADIENSDIIKTQKTLLQSRVVLGLDKDSYITYRVTVKNDSDDDLYYIETNQNSDFYYNDLNNYNDEIVYEISGIEQYEKIVVGEEKSFLVTFKYNVENSELITEENIVLNSYLNFKFKKLYNVTYNNIDNNDYPTKAIDGEDLTITFVSDIPDDVNVEGSCTKKYENGVLTISNISSDLTISNEEGTTLIYTVSTGGLRLGSTVSSSTQSSTVADVSSTYMKYTVNSDNVITKIESCKKETENAKSICLIGADASSYNDNKNAILSYFGGNNDNVPSECSFTDNYGTTELTCKNDYVLLATDDYGGIYINDLENGKSCVINSTFGIYSCK